MRTSCRHGSILSRATAGAAASLLAFSGFSTPVHADETETPIEHVIIIIGENRSFDHLFATYTPPSGQSIWNLLSKGIITAEGDQARISPWPINFRAFESALEIHANANFEDTI